MDLLEEPRLLPSTDTDSHARFACLLVGQPVGRVGLVRLAGLDEQVVWCYEMIGVGECEAKGCLICCIEARRPLDTSSRGAGRTTRWEDAAYGLTGCLTG